MNRPRKVRTRFGPEMRFEVKPVPAAPFRGTQETALEELKERLLKHLLKEVSEVDLNVLIRRAANEACAIAWTTPFPLLLLPALLDEKVESARHQAEQQKAVFKRSRKLFGAAA